MDERSVATEQHYDALAEHWQQISDAPDKEHILRPALEPLLPDLDAIAVLDAGCGDRSDAATLADRGATVVGVDASTNMLEVPRERQGRCGRIPLR